MKEKIEKIRMLVMDVDGVLTDGRLFLAADSHSEAFKAFDSKDGLGITLAELGGLKIAFVTGRPSPIVLRRAQELKVSEVYQTKDKLKAIEELMRKHSLKWENIAYIGDDVTDLGALGNCGFAVAVKNATEEVKLAANYVTQRPGGRGAVRETIELILKTQGKWEGALKAYLEES